MKQRGKVATVGGNLRRRQVVHKGAALSPHSGSLRALVNNVGYRISTLTQISQAGTGRVRAAWLRWQSQVSGLYYRRVTEPVQLWLAVGRAPEFRPQLPWWQPFVWHYLCLTGWQPHRPSLRHRR